MNRYVGPKRRRGRGEGIPELVRNIGHALIGFGCLLVLAAAVHMLGPGGAA